MNLREKVLALGLGSTLAALGAGRVYEALWEGPLEARQARGQKLQSDIARRQVELRQARRSIRQLEEFRRRSLPSNVELARSLYQAWLLELVKRIGLAAPHVDSGSPASQQGMYTTLSFTLRGRGTVEQWTRLLHGFYSASHLHSVRSLTLTPLEQEQLLDASMTIEAVALSDADRNDRLSDPTAGPPAIAAYDAYRAIVDRDLFGIGGGAADAESQALLTAVVDAGGRRQAWITLRASDELLKLHQGDRLDVGSFHGTVAQIDETDLVLEAGSQRWLLSIGERLAEASALPEER